MIDRTNAARQRCYIQRLKNRESLEIERLKQEQKALLLQIEALERLIAEAKAETCDAPIAVLIR